MKDVGIIIAHEFSPWSGSECANGWNIIENLQNSVDIIVFYASSNQSMTHDYEKAVSTYKSTLEARGIYAIPIPYPWFCRLFANISFRFSRDQATGFRVIYFLNYKIWLMQVRKRVKDVSQRSNIRFIHVLNHVSFREPGRFYDLGVPLIWGPISGLARIKDTFIVRRQLGERLSNRLRNASNWVAVRSRNVRETCRKASYIFAVTNEDIDLLPDCSGEVSVLADVGCDSSSQSAGIVDLKQRGPIKLLWVGRIDSNKALHLLFYALEQVRNYQSKYQLTVIGEGPSESAMKKLASEVCCDLKIDWLGQIDHSRVKEIMTGHDLLVLTSLKEAACTVVMESLSQGLPVICHDAFGMANAINESCGWKISYESPDISISQLRDTLIYISEYPNTIAEKSSGALARRHQISWASNAYKISKVYEKILIKN